MEGELPHNVDPELMGGGKKSRAKPAAKPRGKGKKGGFGLTEIASVAALIAATKAIKDARDNAIAKGKVASDPRPLLRRRSTLYSNKGRSYGGAESDEVHGDSSPAAPAASTDAPGPTDPLSGPLIGGGKRRRSRRTGGAEIEAFNAAIANEQFGSVATIQDGGDALAEQFGGKKTAKKAPAKKTAKKAPAKKAVHGKKRGGEGDGDDGVTASEGFQTYGDTEGVPAEGAPASEDVPPANEPQTGGAGRKTRAKGRAAPRVTRKKRHGGDALAALQQNINNFLDKQ
jgi:hypothetical protein